jgi:O-antigen/teichoic acid export membrane protein
MIGKEQYGQVGIIQNTVDMFSIVASLGLSFTATKYVAEFRNTQPERAGRIIALTSGTSWITGGLITLVIIAIAPWLAATTLHEPSMTSMLQVGAFLLFFGTWNSAQVGSLSGLEAFKARAGITAKSGMINFILIVLGVWYAGKMGVIAAAVLSAAVLSIQYSFVLRREARNAGVPLTWNGALKEFPLIVKFGIPAMLSTLVLAPVNWACNTMLVNQPGGYAELGIYNAAFQWNNAILFIPMMISSVSIPILSDLIGQKRWDQVGKLITTSVKMQFIIIIPVGLLAFLSPWLMRLYGPGFSGGSAVMIITIWVALFSALYSPLWPMLYAAGKAKAMLIMNVSCAGLFLLLTHLLIQHGARGLATAKLISNMVNCAWLFVLAYVTIRQGKLKAAAEAPPAVNTTS